MNKTTARTPITTTEPLSFNDLLKLKDLTQGSCNYDSDYILFKITPQLLSMITHKLQLQFEGTTFMMISEGIERIMLNTDICEVKPGTVMVFGPHDVITLDKDINSETLRGYLLILSPSFLRNIVIDPNVIGTAYRPRPAREQLQLDDYQRTLIRKHLEILGLNTAQNGASPYVRAVARNQVASIIYELMEIATHKHDQLSNQPQTSRKVNYTSEFMRLLTENYRNQRSVNFYSSKLCISPKYLSLVIKKTTGRSAAQWIAQYVILEAKNMLRFSGKSIQQIAYELNFSNQSAFGKYFKHITGMSPTEFQRN